MPLFFLNLAHAYDHFFMLIFPTAVLALAPAWGMSYGEALALGTAAFVMFGLGSLPAGWMRFGFASWFGLSSSVWLLILLLAFWFWFKRTRLGISIRATGSNERSALLSGVSPLRINVANAWANKGTNQGQCKQCHVNGQGWLASNDSTRVFNILTTEPNPKGGRFMEMYFVPDMTTNAAAPKMIINRETLERAASGYAQHPLFNVDNDNNGQTPAMQLLQQFYDATAQRQAAKTCDPPKFMP